MPRPPTRGARPTAGPAWDVFWENAGSNFASLLGPWPPTARYRPTGVWGGWQGRTRRSGGRHPVRCTRVADRVGYPWATLLLYKGGEGLRIQRDAGLRQPLNRGNILAPTTYGFFSQARDLAGNIESLKTQAEATTKIVSDSTPPTTTTAASPAPNANGWNNTNVPVTLTAVDNPGGSGVKQLQFTLAGASSGMQVVNGSSAVVAVSVEGTTTLTYSATDNAGNQEAPKTLAV